MASETLPNQYYRELLGVMGISFSDQHNSAARKQMTSSHIGQRLVIKGANERFLQTGTEREYGKYTFKIKMPVDAEIIRCIDRYPRSISKGGIALNPETLVIYEDVKTKEVSCLSIVDYYSNHQYFGFKYKSKPAMAQLHRGAFIEKDTVFADSPTITDDGGYGYGIQANVAFMSHPACSEDGIGVSRDFLESLSFNKYEVRSAEWGSTHYPLNLYGDENNYKPFPDIGDRVRADGLLMAFQKYNPAFSPVEQTKKRTSNVDHIFDKCLYADGPGGLIIDIRVQHDPESVAPVTPICETNPNMSMDAQALKYDSARRKFYQEIVNVYTSLYRDRGQNLVISHEFQRLVVEAMSVVGTGAKRKDGDTVERIVKLYRGVPLDDWRIEFVIEYKVVPREGFKGTDIHGGKGVFCNVVEPEHMPVDADGNRADFIMDPYATVNRMNPGRLYEQFYNAVSRDLLKEIRKVLGVTKETPITENQIANHPQFEYIWSRLIRFYEIISPRMFNKFSSPEFVSKRAKHVKYILPNECLYIYFPPDNEPEAVDIVANLKREYPTTYGPVTYTGYSGNQCTTKQNVRIGSLYIMLLEKIADDWTAVPSCKLQNFGVISQLNINDKYATPTRMQGIRFDGETENRIITSYAGPRVAVEYLDRNNNIASHESVVSAILSSEYPSNIDVAVNRNEVALGNARPLQLTKHYALCSGWKFVYDEHKPQWQGAVPSYNVQLTQEKASS